MGKASLHDINLRETAVQPFLQPFGRVHGGERAETVKW